MSKFVAATGRLLWTCAGFDIPALCRPAIHPGIGRNERQEFRTSKDRRHRLPDKAINEAINAIEEANPYLSGTLPKTYQRIDNPTLLEIMRFLSGIPMDIEGDVFGKIYEYFLGEFARK